MLFMSLTACNKRNDIPSDDRMIELYENNETAFETIRKLLANTTHFIIRYLIKLIALKFLYLQMIGTF